MPQISLEWETYIKTGCCFSFVNPLLELCSKCHISSEIKTFIGRERGNYKLLQLAEIYHLFLFLRVSRSNL